ALLAIIALFFLGARLPDLIGPAPAVVAPTGSPSPSASPGIALGPVAPGEYAWDELLGGECLDPFESPWQTTYVVVECADPHPAQMVHRGELPETTATAFDYPGEDVLQTQVIGLCRGAGIFDPAVVSALTDAVVQASYPTQEIWDDGGRDYYCFVSRSSGEPLTGDLALPQVAPVPPAEPAP
ncbi:MAG: large membrane associated protein, partial [Pseudolysinimonas sp.]